LAGKEKRWMKSKRLVSIIFAAASLGVLVPHPSEANTGMQNIAYGAKSAGRGGTSIAVGDDTTVMNTNPAAVSKIEGGRLDINLEMMFPLFSFENPDNDTRGKHPIYLIPSAGIAYHQDASKWSFGIGMFNEGGTGTDYGLLRVNNDVLGPGIGTTYIEYFSQFSYMKVTPTIAYNLTDKISIALSPHLGYSMMRMKMPFFEPSLNRFWAADMDGDAASLSGKIGILYHLKNQYGFGIVYTAPTDMNLKGDVTMTAPTGDISGMPQQSVMKGDLEMNMGWPQSVKAGTFVRLKSLGGMLVAFDVEWLNWSHYYREIPVKMTRISMNGMPVADREFKMKTDWRDQWVFKLGMEYPATDHLNLRMGYIYGKNPVPPEGALATMNPFVEHHLTGGLGYGLSTHFELNLAAVYGLSEDVKVGDTHNISPDMRNSKTGMEFLSTSMMLSYKW